MTDPAAGTLRRTSLHDEHIALGARMVPFAGWDMPVQYAGIIDEHNAVRRDAGMFDVSHMGRYEVSGPEAARLLRYVCTYDMTRLEPGRGHYAAVCNPQGGIMDDVYVYRLPAGRQGPTDDRYLLVANASNAEKIRDWLLGHAGRFEAEVVDQHTSTCMIAVQGPRALERLATVLDPAFVASLKPRACGQTEWSGASLFASRTGYTGEDGLELVTAAEAGPALWRALLQAGVAPCGLGARDTLRLEAALLLYGNDMDETVNPFEVGLGWVVTLDDGADFVGREALVRASEEPPSRVLACLKATERGVMRPGCDILRSGRTVGKVTSGGHSPTLGLSIGMGFLPPDAVVGTELTVDVRGRPLAARVVPRPFYKRPPSGAERTLQP
jgi:aminomethyltransferase